MAEWKLEEKDGIKYFRLDFENLGWKDLKCLFIARNESSGAINDKSLARLFNTFGIGRINFLKQIHSDKIFYVSEHNFIQRNLEGDGMFTNRLDTFLGVNVADCLPIYFFSSLKKIIGIVHSKE